MGTVTSFDRRFPRPSERSRQLVPDDVKATRLPSALPNSPSGTLERVTDGANGSFIELVQFDKTELGVSHTAAVVDSERGAVSSCFRDSNWSVTDPHHAQPDRKVAKLGVGADLLGVRSHRSRREAGWTSIGIAIYGLPRVGGTLCSAVENRFVRPGEEIGSPANREEWCRSAAYSKFGRRVRRFSEHETNVFSRFRASGHSVQSESVPCPNPVSRVSAPLFSTRGWSDIFAGIAESVLDRGERFSFRVNHISRY